MPEYKIIFRLVWLDKLHKRNVHKFRQCVPAMFMLLYLICILCGMASWGWYTTWYRPGVSSSRKVCFTSLPAARMLTDRAPEPAPRVSTAKCYTFILWQNEHLLLWILIYKYMKLPLCHYCYYSMYFMFKILCVE